MRFTTTTVVSILAGSAFAAPTDMSANRNADVASADMATDAAAVADMRLADMFSERQLAVLKVLAEHKHELGMDEKEVELMDTFMESLNEKVHLSENEKRQLLPNVTTPSLPVVSNLPPVSSLPVVSSLPAVSNLPVVSTLPVVSSLPTVPNLPSVPVVGNVTALGNLGSAIDALNAVNAGAAGAAVGTTAGALANATTAAVTGAGSPLDILKSIPALGNLLSGAASGATTGLGGATGALGGATGALSGLTGGLGGLTGGLTGATGGLTGGLGGLTGLGGLGGLLGLNPLSLLLLLRRGGLLGGILIPGIL